MNKSKKLMTVIPCAQIAINLVYTVAFTPLLLRLFGPGEYRDPSTERQRAVYFIFFPCPADQRDLCTDSGKGERIGCAGNRNDEAQQ